MAAGDIEAGEITLLGRYQLAPEVPLPHLDSPTAKAYSVVDRVNPKRRLFCLICDPQLPPRRSLIQRFKGRFDPAYLNPLDDGVCDWPPLGRRALAIVLPRPEGDRLAAGLCLPPADLLRKVVTPIAETLRAFDKRGLAHRALRPDNLFWTGLSKEAVMLGECVSAPPGYSQPVAFETLDNVVAARTGRSPGTGKDDLYALGVLILTLCRAPSFSLELEDEKLARRKLDVGTVGTLIGSDPPPSELNQILRALLCDDPDQRWTTDELLAWLKNERSTPMRATTPAQAARIFEIGDHRCATVRSLAYGLADNPTEAIEAVHSGQVEQWLRNAANAEKAADELEAMHAGPKGRLDRPNARANATLLARVSLVLDPDGPFRYGSLSVMPEGLGTALYTLFARNQPVTDFAGLIEGQIAAWLPADRAKGLPGFQGWIDRMYVHLKDRGLGGGIERCLYEMNPDLPCLGDTVGRYCVVGLEPLLMAIEENAARADLETSPIDSHVAAYAQTQLALRRTPLAMDVAEQGRSGNRALFELGLLTAVQKAAKRPAPFLCRWMVHRIAPRVADLHNRRLRRRIASAFERRKEEGSLAGLMEIINNPKMWTEDARGLTAAQEVYLQNRNTFDLLEKNRQTVLDRALESGLEMAVALSLCVALALASIGVAVQSMS